jgi:hypothetical protein
MPAAHQQVAAKIAYDAEKNPLSLPFPCLPVSLSFMIIQYLQTVNNPDREQAFQTGVNVPNYYKSI